MTVIAANVRISGVDFLVVKVNRNYLNNTALSKDAILYYRSIFKVANVVLMGQDLFGNIKFYGRNEILNILRNIDTEQIPFGKYKIS